MVNLEAGSLGTPSITTHATGLEEWADVGGVLIDDCLESLIAALEGVTTWTAYERLQRGRQCRAHVLNHYSLDAVGHEWMRFYASLLVQSPGAACMQRSTT